MNGNAIWSNTVGTGIDVDKLKNKVTSVNGKTGEVKLSAEDVGALPKDTEIPSISGLATEKYVDDAIKKIKIPESGTSDYTQLTNKPKINGVELDGDKTLEALGIPTGGGSEAEWKRLARIEVAEDEVKYFLLTEDENGKDFSAKEFTLRLKVVKRTAVSSFRLVKPDYVYGEFYISGSKTFAQTNQFGNTGGDRYYTIQALSEGNWRKTFFSESNANIFSTENVFAAANNVYASGVTYTVGTLKFPLDEIAVFATNGFFTGDIIEIWYR